MKDLVDKFVALEREISAERGSFALFGLFLREDAADRWDLVVAAPWFSSNEKKVLDYLTQKIQSRLKPHELVLLSRIVVADPSDASVKAIQAAFKIEHGKAEIRDSVFFGLHIRHAYVITSQRLNGNSSRNAVQRVATIRNSSGR
jgi:hypothetical protein